MMSLINYWPVAALLVGCAAFGCSNSDSPVSDEGAKETAIQEGVVGRVADIDGHPIEGALIQPRSLDSSPPPIPEIAILSRGNGQYNWPLMPGAYEIAVTADGFQNETKRVQFGTGQVVHLDFRLEKTR